MKISINKAQWVVLALMCAILAALSVAKWETRWRTSPDENYLSLFREVVDIVGKSYVEKVDRKKLIEGAVTGMLESLDPHSSFMPPDSFKEMQISTSGAFGGVGIEITLRNGRLTVISPIDDTPASRAGIRAGDVISRIDGRSTHKMSMAQAVERMRGPSGSKVTLTVVREGTDRRIEFPLVRAIIKVKSLRSRTLENGIGYIRILQFQQRTSEDFADALAKLGRETGGLKGLVLDLRNNPGGLLDQAVGVANRFIGGKPGGNDLIVYTRGRTADSRMDFHATVGDKEPLYPIVVLINGGSASASEIVAGALQDHKRGVVLGTQSFGKGSVQSILSLGSNGGVLLTTARYYTPGGRSIQATGITPDIVVENMELPHPRREEGHGLTERDLENHLAAGDADEPAAQTAKKHMTREESDPLLNDYQAFRAIELLKGWQSLTPAKTPPRPEEKK